MPEAPFQIIFQMLTTLITDTVTTFDKIFVLFGNLMQSLGFVSAEGGIIGFGLSLIILAVVGLFILKFVLGGVTKLAILVIVAVIILYILILGALA